MWQYLWNVFCWCIIFLNRIKNILPYNSLVHIPAHVSTGSEFDQHLNLRIFWSLTQIKSNVKTLYHLLDLFMGWGVMEWLVSMWQCHQKVLDEAHLHKTDTIATVLDIRNLINFFSGQSIGWELIKIFKFVKVNQF